MGQVYSMNLNTISDTHYLHAKFTRKCIFKILIHLLLWIRMNKSSTFKAIKVCCSLITPFTSFTTVFLKIQGSASNLAGIYPHENSNSREACFNPFNTLRIMYTPLSPGAIGVPYVS